jgi:hypothetical protein
MVPTLTATLGVKGRRPAVGTRDDKDLLHVFGAVNCADGRPHARALATRAKALRAQRLKGPAGRKKVGKTRRMTAAFAAHLRDIAKAYPAHLHPRVVLIVDNAPWHRGQPVRDVLAEFPHLELYRLPSYSPQLNVIERVSSGCGSGSAGGPPTTACSTPWPTCGPPSATPSATSSECRRGCCPCSATATRTPPREIGQTHAACVSG